MYTTSLSTVKHVFVGKLWENLGYNNQTKACRGGVKEHYKTQRCELADPSNMIPHQRNINCINEPGLWSCLDTSKQEQAEHVQIWVYEVAFPKVEKEHS